LGKQLLGLRVLGPHGEAPGMWRGLLRATIIPGLPQLTISMATMLLPELHEAKFGKSGDAQSQVMATLATQAIGVGGWCLALLCLLPMRRRNGFRGLHELISGTRTISPRRLRKPSNKLASRVAAAADHLGLTIASGSAADTTLSLEPSNVAPNGEASLPFPAQVGSFQDLRVLGRSGEAVVCAGRDRALDRTIWILYRPDAQTPLPEKRLHVARSTRLHWLQGGEAPQGRWDAFEAPAGAPLTGVLANSSGLDWEQGCALLGELARELIASIEDGTLPETLVVEQVWLDAQGRIKLLDAPLRLGEATAPESERREPLLGNEREPGATRAVHCFCETARQCAQGQLLPGGAYEFLEQLAARPNELPTLRWSLERLDQLAHRPARLRWDDRLGAIAVAASAEQPLFVTLVWLTGLALPLAPGVSLGGSAAILAVVALVFPALSGFLWRGGPVFQFLDIQVRRRDGRLASRWRCTWRNLCAWAPMTLGNALLVLLITRILSDPNFEDEWISEPPGRFGLNVVSLVCGVTLPFLTHISGGIYAVFRPSRGVQDLLAGTVLTPR
jgi:hypothetical protein